MQTELDVAPVSRAVLLEDSDWLGTALVELVRVPQAVSIEYGEVGLLKHATCISCGFR